MRASMFLVVVFIALCPQTACAVEPVNGFRTLTYVENGHERQRLDLYLPQQKNLALPPLLIFVHGGYWSEGDENYGIGPGLAHRLKENGVAVALLRYRLAPTHAHPAQIEDVASAFAYLQRNASRYGYDAKRMHLAGHSAGGHLVALLALDPRYLAKHSLKSMSIASVIGLSGIYSLDIRGTAPYHKAAVHQTFGGDAMELGASSPINHVAGKAPPFLLLNPARDLPRLQLHARRFAEALSDSGTEVDYLVLPQLDHLSVARPDARGNPLEHFILWRMAVKPLPDRLEALRAARRAWMQPPLSTAGFWKQYAPLIEPRQIDKRFLQALFFLYQGARYELKGWPLKTYHRIELLRLMDALPSQDGGDYLVLRNALNEVQVWHRSEIEAYKPVIVVGLDEEKNLFKLQLFYQMQREYTWRDTESPPMMVLPLGAFVYFEEVPPLSLRPQLWHYSLTVEGIGRSKNDPLAEIRTHPDRLLKALTEKNGCVYCHRLGTVGSRAHHLTAFDAKPHGGYALPLEAYPPAVIDRFIDHQEEVAAQMGATPNKVEPEARESLRRAIAQARMRQQR